MKLFILILAIGSLYSCSSATGDSSAPPIVGHWTFIQATVDNPISPMYPNDPMTCVGDLDVREDGTYSGWNACKQGAQEQKVVGSWTSNWTRISQYHYKANGLDYDVILNKDGTMGMYAATASTGNLKGHHEYGYMFKDVSVDHSELQ